MSSLLRLTVATRAIVVAALFGAGLTFFPVPALSGAASPHAAGPSVCGSQRPSPGIEEPPNVDVSALPLDATGEHELILAVHRSGAHFCYRYRWNDAVWTTAPTLWLRRGERFAVRIVNDIVSQSKGESVLSSAIPECMPMSMPDVRVRQYVGYLNHTIHDRYLSTKPIDTNFHLHGFIGSAAEEDVFLSTLSTPMHACEYHVTIPSSQPPGTYFYHPHAHGASDAQVARGLSGAWIVEPDKPELARSAQHVVILKYRLPVKLDNAFVPDDSAIGAVAALHEAALKPAPPVAYDPFDPPPWPLSFPMKAGAIAEDRSGCNGIDSEPLSAVDGSYAPAQLDVPAGRTQLLRLINATSDSPKALELHDAGGRTVPMQVVARDGTPVGGNAEKPLSNYIPLTQVLLAPFSRADVLVTVGPGETLTLASAHFCGGADAFFQMNHDLLRITGSAANAAGPAILASSPLNLADAPAAKLVAFARAHANLVRRRAITFTEYVFPAEGKTPLHSGFYITDTTKRKFHEHSFWPMYAAGASVPFNADVVVKAGTIEEWYLINTTMEAHAFHIHQMSFVEEKSPAGLPLTEDSAFVPVGKLLPNPQDPNYPLVRPSITKLLLDFRHVLPGTFVFHCHMLFHEDRGMMATIRVEKG